MQTTILPSWTVWRFVRSRSCKDPCRRMTLLLPPAKKKKRVHQIGPDIQNESVSRAWNEHKKKKKIFCRRKKRGRRETTAETIRRTTATTLACCRLTQIGEESKSHYETTTKKREPSNKKSMHTSNNKDIPLTHNIKKKKKMKLLRWGVWFGSFREES